MQQARQRDVLREPPLSLPQALQEERTGTSQSDRRQHALLLMERQASGTISWVFQLCLSVRIMSACLSLFSIGRDGGGGGRGGNQGGGFSTPGYRVVLQVLSHIEHAYSQGDPKREPLYIINTEASIFTISRFLIIVSDRAYRKTQFELLMIKYHFCPCN